MKRFKTLHKLRFAFYTWIACVLIFMTITFANMRNASRESRNVRNTLITLNVLENLLVKIQAIETGQRGYTISGSEQFLKGYNNALSTIDVELRNLKFQIEKDALSAKGINDVIRMVNRKISYSKYVVETRRINGFEASAAITNSGEGMKLMDSITNVISEIEVNHRVLLRTLNATRETYASRISFIVFTLSLVFLLIFVFGFVLIKKDLLLAEKLNRRLRYNATLLSNISDPIITTDPDGVITNWNEHAAALYGFSAADAEGKLFNELLKDQLFSADSPVANREATHIHKNGSEIIAEIKTATLRDEEGETTGTISVVRDMTARKILEEKLKQLSDNLQQEVIAKAAELNHVFERVTDAFIALDNNWVYTHVNEVAARLHNMQPADLIGKVMWDVFPEVVGEPFYDALMHAAKTREPQRLELYFKSREKWYEDLIYPGEDGISVYYHDISERKNAQVALQISEEALRFSNDRFEKISKATNDAVWDWDMEADILWGNDVFNRLFNLVNRPARFEDFLNLVHPDDKEVLLKNFQQKLISKEQLLTEEFRVTDSSGRERVMYDRAYIIYNESGRAYRMVGAMQDISLDKEAEQRLLNEKELSDSIINSLPGIFYLYNKDGKFLRWNKNFQRITGYTGAEFGLLHPLDFFKEEDKKFLADKISQVYTEGETHAEAELLLKDGSTIPYYFTGMTIKYEGEACLAGVGIDISERVASQKELRKSEEKYRAVVEQASDAIFIVDEKGFFLDVNASAVKLTGYSKEQLLKLNLTEIYREEDVKRKPLHFDQLKKGVSVLTERALRKKDGSIIYTEISANMTEQNRFQGIMRDITSRKKAEEALKASEHKYHLLFDENPLPMWIVSYPDHTFLDVNDAAISAYGYTYKEFLRIKPEDLYAEKELFSLSYHEDISKGSATVNMATHIKKNGQEINVNVFSHGIIYEDKTAILCLVNDVTEKLRAEADLQKSHEEMRELASHLETVREAERTHMAREIHDELGQQLTGLKMDISWLNRRVKSEDEQVMQKMKDTIELIDKTVITVRRIATQLRPSILDDLGLIAAMEWQTEEFEKHSEIKAIFKSNTAHITVTPDVATALFRIFQESLTNVLRHSKASSVETFLSVDNDSVVLNIKDNGIGFKSNDIFNKKTLGLMGMKERVLLIRGTCEINGNTGNGTSVIITVPLK